MTTLLLWYIALVGVLGMVLNLYGMVRSIRSYRQSSRLSALNRAYEKQLIDMGATLPARCVCCCQVLPAHVDCCYMSGYEEMNRLLEFLSRPPIQVSEKQKRVLRVPGEKL